MRMKRSDFIKKVLKSKRNTVFVNEEQVENSLMIFESLGMIPPYNNKGLRVNDEAIKYCKWENEDD